MLLLEGQLDVPVVSMLEQKFEKSRFVRVDSDIIERLIPKADDLKSDLSDTDRENLSQVFRSQIPHINKVEFMAEVQPLGSKAQPILITQSEYMRRMKEMSRFQPGMSFYAQMPDTFSMVLNSDHQLVKRVLEECKADTADRLKPVDSEIKGLEARLAALRQSQKDKKPEDVTAEEKEEVQKTEKDIADQRSKKQEVLNSYAKDNKVVHQLIDLALLQNGMLKGAALDAFLKRSVDLIK